MRDLYTNAVLTPAALAVMALASMNPAGGLTLRPSAIQTVSEVRVSLRSSGNTNIRVSEPSRDLVDADFAVLTEADIHMLEFAMSIPKDDIDYSELVFDDDDV